MAQSPAVTELLAAMPAVPAGGAHPRLRAAWEAWECELQWLLAGELALLDAQLLYESEILDAVVALFAGVPVSTFQYLDSEAAIQNYGYEIAGRSWHWKLRRTRNKPDAGLFAALKGAC